MLGLIKYFVAEWNYKDPERYYKVDIGYTIPAAQRKGTVQERLQIRKEIKENLELEKSAKKGTCMECYIESGLIDGNVIL